MNVDLSIVVTRFDITTDSKLVQSENAALPSVVMLSGMITEVRFVHLLNASCPIYLTLFEMVTEVRVSQPSNARSWIISTLFGIVTEVTLAHFLNAPCPISFTLSGMKTLASEPLYRFNTPSSILKSFCIFLPPK